jgi:hypothetical protein
MVIVYHPRGTDFNFELGCASMVDKAKGRAIATKIKKWLETVRELNEKDHPWAISITRLTSVKSLCQDEDAAKQFALFMAQRIQAQMLESSRPEHFSPEEWQKFLALFEVAIALMEGEAKAYSQEGTSAISKLRREIEALQGDDYRNIPWGTVHFVHSGDLLNLTYALQCFDSRDAAYWAYKLAREYVEAYNPSYGTGIIPKSIPMLLDVAEFWCLHYFEQSLSEKFPEFFPQTKFDNVEHLG